jgi:hypothetical protein
MPEKAKNYYDKAVAAKVKDHPIDKSFSLYKERLYTLIFQKRLDTSERDVLYGAFVNVLDSWIESARSFELEAFKNEIENRVMSGRPKTHDIYFGVPLREQITHQFAFSVKMSFKDITFKKASYRSISSLGSGAFIKALAEDYQKLGHSKLEVSRTLKDHFIYIKASTSAVHESIAIQKVLDAFEIFSACVNVAHESNHYVTTYANRMGVKSRRPVVLPISLYTDHKNPQVGIHQVIIDLPGDSVLMPDAKLRDFKEYKKRYDRLKRFVSGQQLTPIAQRLQSVLLQYDRALGCKDPHLRALSFWRCLEIATAKNSQARTHDEILSILSGYRTDEVWQEMGKLIKEQRNYYVHYGRELSLDNRDNYLNWQQAYATAILEVLVYMCLKKIGSEKGGAGEKTINDFFDMYQLPSSKLQLGTWIKHRRSR